MLFVVYIATALLILGGSIGTCFMEDPSALLNAVIALTIIFVILTLIILDKIT